MYPLAFASPTQSESSTLIFPYKGFSICVDMRPAAPALRITTPESENVTAALLPASLAHPMEKNAARASAEAFRVAMLNVDIEVLRRAVTPPRRALNS